MLIWIDESVADADLNIENDVCAGVGAILDSSYRGDHLVLSTRSVLKKLKENESLSVLQHKIISKIIGNLPTTGGIEREVPTRIIATYNKAAFVTRLSSGCWEVPIKKLGVTGVSKVILLAENLNDASAYAHAGKLYQDSAKYSFQQAIEKSGGGGSTISNCFENHIVNENRWCLCITDSDKTHPKFGMSSSAKKCKELAESPNTIGLHLDLDVREIENLIPITLLSESIQNTLINELDWHKEKIIKHRDDVHLYADLKDGLTLGKLLNFDDLAPEKIYWLKVVDDLIRNGAFSSKCFTNKNCKKNDISSCLCHVTYGFGNGLLTNVLKNLDQRTVQNTGKMIKNDFNLLQWHSIGRTVYEWAIAPAKSRV